MALPKYKIRRSHSRSRRAANFLSQIRKPALTVCPRPDCGAYIREHFACPKCGYYAGLPAVTIRQRKKAEE